MTADALSMTASLTRRRFLQGAIGGVAGATAWLQGWPRRTAAEVMKGAATGQMVWALHITIAPTWFDPAETLGVITPFMFLYALHDALVKPMPVQLMAPSLATSWTESPDGLTYEFALREGVTFHNGDPFTAEDVQFSFARYRGAAASTLKRKVQAVEIVNPHQVRFRLHEPWPDFLTFYGTPASGVGWIVPKRYTEQVGDEAFKDRPIGLGPYRFVGYESGVELVLEAHPHYWRKIPHVKRLVLKSTPEADTRLAMLKNREADVAYALYGPLAEEVRRDPTLKLEPVHPPGTQWITFIDQYNPQSPWADRRVRLAANHAVDWQALNEAMTLGYSVLAGSIIPPKFDYALPLEPYGYDLKKAKQLLAEAGYPQGFEAGECTVDAVYADVAETAINGLAAVGIHAKVRPMERAAVFAAQREKTVQHLTLQGSGAYGNAATRIEAFVDSHGANSFIHDPQIDAWYAQQAVERDRQKRQTVLHQVQRKIYEEARFMPVWELGFLCASGPRVAVSGLGLIPLFAYSGPCEDVQLKA